jgi:hypothetical protein
VDGVVGGLRLAGFAFRLIPSSSIG